MKIKALFLFAFVLIGSKSISQDTSLAVSRNNAEKAQQTKEQMIESSKLAEVKSIYDFVVKDIDGNDFQFSKLKGKKIIIVNTASECGFTPQYKELEALYKRFKGRLVIIGFPANNFGGQEPGSDKEIATFCQKNYGVTFPMMAKISVKGDDMAMIYRFLTKMEFNKFADSQVEWNFQKYLIDEKGQLVKVLPSKVSPNDSRVTDWILSQD